MTLIAVVMSGQLGCWQFIIKADMKSYKSLETTAIFYSSEPFLKQGIS